MFRKLFLILMLMLMCIGCTDNKQENNVPDQKQSGENDPEYEVISETVEIDDSLHHGVIALIDEEHGYFYVYSSLAEEDISDYILFEKDQLSGLVVGDEIAFKADRRTRIIQMDKQVRQVEYILRSAEKSDTLFHEPIVLSDLIDFTPTTIECSYDYEERRVLEDSETISKVMEELGKITVYKDGITLHYVGGGALLILSDGDRTMEIFESGLVHNLLHHFQSVFLNPGNVTAANV